MKLCIFTTLGMTRRAVRLIFFWNGNKSEKRDIAVVVLIEK